MKKFGPEENKSAELLVEGVDDLHFVKQFHDKLQLNLSFGISVTNGFNKLCSELPIRVSQSGIKILGVIVDADDDLDERWNEVVGVLTDKGISAPESPTPSGTIIQSNNRLPKLGIWVMPDNKSIGELEDFAFNMIDKNDRVKPLAQCYINSIPKNLQKFKNNKRPKAELFAWLAHTEEPGRIGASIGAGNFDIHSPISKEFANWLNQLFG